MLPLDNIGVLVGAGVGFAMGYSRSLEEGGAAAISAAVLLPTLVYQECYLKHSKIGVKALYVAFFSGWCSAAIAGLYLGAMNDTMMGAILGPGLTFPCVAIVLFLGSESFYDSDRGKRGPGNRGVELAVLHAGCGICMGMAAAFAGGKANFTNASNLLALQYYGACFTALATAFFPWGIRHGAVQMAAATALVTGCLQYQGHMKATGGVERAVAELAGLPERLLGLCGMAVAKGSLALLGHGQDEL